LFSAQQQRTRTPTAGRGRRARAFHQKDQNRAPRHISATTVAAPTTVPLRSPCHPTTHSLVSYVLCCRRLPRLTEHLHLLQHQQHVLSSNRGEQVTDRSYSVRVCFRKLQRLSLLSPSRGWLMTPMVSLNLGAHCCRRACRLCSRAAALWEQRVCRKGDLRCCTLTQPYAGPPRRACLTSPTRVMDQLRGPKKWSAQHKLELQLLSCISAQGKRHCAS